MSDLLKFYVRIILTEFEYEIFAPLHNLNIEIREFLSQLVNELEKEGSKDFGNVIKKAFNSTKIYCFKKPCNLNCKFIELLSKIEKFNGKEIDVFELVVK
ncbi:MAG: hypothetical protein EU532_11615 [Promethearchaeota archaeon]|nr:MAG: hypothetical protein EU532_11615 [Candidatus Lokiarchaeota archaeon]